IRVFHVTGVQTCALPIFLARANAGAPSTGNRSVRLRSGASRGNSTGDFPPRVPRHGLHPFELRQTLDVERHGARRLFVASSFLEIGRASCRASGEMWGGV